MAKGIKKVAKALAPEEQSVVENILSLANQLLAGEGAEEEVMMGEDEMVDGEEDMDGVEKANMGPTANPEDKAEDRVEEPTGITAGNLSEVGKSVTLQSVGESLQALVKKQSVAKSKKENAMVMKSLSDIAKALKTISDRQTQQELAFKNLLDGIGFTGTVEKSVTSKPKPVANLDNSAVMLEIANVLKDIRGGQENQSRPNRWSVQKSAREDLKNALPYLLGR